MGETNIRERKGMTGIGANEDQEREKLEREIAELASRIGTAYHEVGHAVAAWHYGLKFSYVTIVPELEIGLAGQVRGLEYDEHSIQENVIVGYFAGRIAESKIGGIRPRFSYRWRATRKGSPPDNAIAFTLASHHFHNRNQTQCDYMKYCWRLSRDLVNLRWEEIMVLATALLERQTLQYADAIELIGFPPRTNHVQTT
jgi:hypothetical protein